MTAVAEGDSEAEVTAVAEGDSGTEGRRVGARAGVGAGTGVAAAAGDRSVRWYVWVPRAGDGPDEARGIFGFNPGCPFLLNRRSLRWESDSTLVGRAFGPGSDPKVEVDAASAGQVAARFGTTLPDVSHEWPPCR